MAECVKCYWRGFYTSIYPGGCVLSVSIVADAKAGINFAGMRIAVVITSFVMFGAKSQVA